MFERNPPLNKYEADRIMPILSDTKMFVPKTKEIRFAVINKYGAGDTKINTTIADTNPTCFP